MTRKALFIAALIGLGSTAHAQQYQMDVETVDGLFTSYLVNDMQAVAYENGVRFTTGLDLIRTAPAHGVNYAAAGKNITDEQSLRNAIYVAIDVWRNRQNYDKPYENPLPKLYHERRDESEKVRFHKKPEE